MAAAATATGIDGVQGLQGAPGADLVVTSETLVGTRTVTCGGVVPLGGGDNVRGIVGDGRSVGVHQSAFTLPYRALLNQLDVNVTTGARARVSVYYTRSPNADVFVDALPADGGILVDEASRGVHTVRIVPPIEVARGCRVGVGVTGAGTLALSASVRL